MIEAMSSFLIMVAFVAVLLFILWVVISIMIEFWEGIVTVAGMALLVLILYMSGWGVR